MRSDQLRDLLALGLSDEQFKSVVEIVSRRSPGAIRQARYEQKKRTSVRTDVRNDVTSDVRMGTIGEDLSFSLTSSSEPLSETKRVVVARDKPKVVDPAFEKFKEVYPARKGSYGWTKARKVFDRWVARGVDPQAIITGADRYAELMQETDRLETEYVKMPTTWLNQEGWKDAEEDIQEFKLNGHANGRGDGGQLH
jgi:hypothetical protein